MTLDPKQRSKVLRGERMWIELERPDDCPQGEEVLIGTTTLAQVTLEWRGAKKVDGQWWADYVVRDNRPRLLHKDSSHGYTHNAAQALKAEPEAVTEAEQRELTLRAHTRALERQTEEQRRQALIKQEKACRELLKQAVRMCSLEQGQALLGAVESAAREAMMGEAGRVI